MNIIPYKKLTLEVNSSIDIRKKDIFPDSMHRETIDKEDLKDIQDIGWILRGFQRHATPPKAP